jgi:hypothetical protein
LLLTMSRTGGSTGASVSVQNLSWRLSRLTEVFLRFSSVPTGKCQDNNSNSSLHVPTYSLFIILRCITL